MPALRRFKQHRRKRSEYKSVVETFVAGGSRVALHTTAAEGSTHLTCEGRPTPFGRLDSPSASNYPILTIAFAASVTGAGGSIYVPELPRLLPESWRQGRRPTNNRLNNLRPTFEAIPVSNVTTALISEYIESRQLKGIQNGTINRELAKKRVAGAPET